MVYGFVKQSGGHLVIYIRGGRGHDGGALPSALRRSSARADGGRRSDELPRGRWRAKPSCCARTTKAFALFSSETLRDLGYEVIEARDAADAMAMMREHQPVDLLFTDVVLPGDQTGADLAREARKLQADLKVLFTTGYARSALDKESSGEKGIELLLKPFGV